MRTVKVMEPPLIYEDRIRLIWKSKYGSKNAQRKESMLCGFMFMEFLQQMGDA
jgi:hypothetical protein